MATRLFTSESVTEGHPDKICDQISDAVLDAVLRLDPEARVAIECVTKTGFVMVVGELTTSAYVDIAKVARETLRQIGYDDPHIGFDWETCGVQVSISEQSPDISRGVAAADGRGQGAGDQGMMFGYACDETPQLMPLPITLAHQLAERLAALRKSKALPYLRPDGKSQVTIEYDGPTPLRLHTVVLSSHHTKGVPQARIRADLIEGVVRPVCRDWLDEHTVFHINPTGQFVVGGPVADSGLTGRKIIVDTYGGYARHGGGAFSGKDPSKVDRSAAYMARHIAKNLVAAGLADRCEIQLAYAIGVADPVSVLVETFGTGALPEDQLAELVRQHFPLTPAGMIAHLDLKKPIYQQTAAYGHFGRPNFSWERLGAAAALKRALEARQALPALFLRRTTHIGRSRPRAAPAQKAT